MKEPLGPNVKRLWATFVAHHAIPHSTENGKGLAAGIGFIVGLSKKAPESAEVLRKAREDTEASIAAIKTAPDNPYGDDEERIAEAILEKVAERQKAQRQKAGAR